ncbi:MAG: hypothetical protein JSV86_18240 [Gemmatimonadota bacterium]|nr:MAG: hypothetical protein JSV86_18240 [Gemmatimonadota bacterium]
MNGKGDTIRLLDVFIIGPVMMRGGYELKDKPIGAALFALGALTVVFNGLNLLSNGRKP